MTNQGSKNNSCPTIASQSFVFSNQPGRSRLTTFCATWPFAWFTIVRQLASIAGKRSDSHFIDPRIFAMRVPELVQRRFTLMHVDRGGRLRQSKDGVRPLVCHFERSEKSLSLPMQPRRNRDASSAERLRHDNQEKLLLKPTPASLNAINPSRTVSPECPPKCGRYF